MGEAYKMSERQLTFQRSKDDLGVVEKFKKHTKMISDNRRTR